MCSWWDPQKMVRNAKRAPISLAKKDALKIFGARARYSAGRVAHATVVHTLIPAPAHWLSRLCGEAGGKVDSFLVALLGFPFLMSAVFCIDFRGAISLLIMGVDVPGIVRVYARYNQCSSLRIPAD